MGVGIHFHLEEVASGSIRLLMHAIDATGNVQDGFILTFDDVHDHDGAIIRGLSIRG